MIMDEILKMQNISKLDEYLILSFYLLLGSSWLSFVLYLEL